MKPPASCTWSRMPSTISGPIVIGGTKWPSITSTWITRAPASMTACTCSSSRPKSADRIDGATRRPSGYSVAMDAREYRRNLIQVCSNGDRPRGAHPAVPITPDELAADAAACVRAGAAAFHIHPRDPEGLETLEAEPTAAALQAVRAAVPGVPVGGTTMIGIAGDDPERRLSLVRGWTVKPDFVSLNMEEPGADELARLLIDDLGVGIEAGVFTVEDAEALAASSFRDSLVRVLVEVDDEDPEAAVARCWQIEEALDAAAIATPRLHHAEDTATFAVIDAALARGRDVRIGVEDTLVMADGSPAESNPALVAGGAPFPQGCFSAPPM